MRKCSSFSLVVCLSGLIFLSQPFSLTNQCQTSIRTRVVTEDSTFEEDPLCLLERKRNFLVTVTVKDRINYVKLFAENLAWLNMSCHAEVHVFDNGSRQFSTSDLQMWFPFASIHPIDTPHDADMVTRRAFTYFITSSNISTLINLDSDSLLHPDWSNFVNHVLPLSDGALSLYHSSAPWHQSFNCNEVTCQKNTTGALGMVFRRDVIEDALKVVHASKEKERDSFDWALCSYLQGAGKKILVPRRSLVLHYGLHGAHGDGSSHAEVDEGFDLSTLPATLRGQVRFFLENKFVDERR